MLDAPLESICFSMIDADSGSHNAQLPSEFALSPPEVHPPPSFTLFGMRSYSFTGFSDHQDLGNDVNYFSDGASFFSLDQNIFR
jgi:hypothetical protein